MTGLAARLLALMIVGAPSVAAAGSFGVAPTRLDLSPTQRSGVVTLENQAAEPVTVQVQAFAWPRSSATEDLEPTRELIAVPAVFALDPAGKQIIRVALRDEPDGPIERAYRLLISEVPIGDGGKDSGVRFALRLSLPIFFTPPGAAPDPSWTVGRSAQGSTLELANGGTGHLRLLRIALTPLGRSDPVQVIEEPAYVLPGQTARWALSPAALAHPTLSLTAETLRGELQATLIVPR